MNTHTSTQSSSEGGKTKRVILSRLPAMGGYLVFLGVVLFGLAGRLDWWMGWAYFGMYLGVVVVGLLVVPWDPERIEERTRITRETKSWDKLLSGIGSAFTPTGLLVVAGLDQRYGWTTAEIPLWLQIVALVIAALGYLLIDWAVAANRFFSRFVRIQKERGHMVVSDGPYRYVRHPGYIGGIVFVLASALALDSLWTLAVAVIVVMLGVLRTALEDRTLHEELGGYREYAARVRYRLLPGIW